MKARCLLTLVVLFGAASAYADDLNPPPWRGDAGTTFQMWEFSTPDNPVAAAPASNPYGIPIATVKYDKPFLPWLPEDYGHQGVWYVEDWMELLIPNTRIPNPIKEIWLQLTYYADGSGDPQIFTDPAWSALSRVNRVQLDPWYRHDTYLITLRPNPPIESIFILPRDCTIYIDEVVVDTICMPEPMAAMLLAFGSLVLVRRKRG